MAKNSRKDKNREKILYKAVIVNNAQFKRRTFHALNLILRLSSWKIDVWIS